MLKMRLLSFMVTVILVLPSCVSFGSFADAARNTCELGKQCHAIGQLEMSSDGHGFIGVMRFGDGRCVNVSLPDEQSRLIIGKPTHRRKVKGNFMAFVFDSEEMFMISGRRIGLGRCGVNYIFVE
jgi:hypothetical protein